MAAEHTPLQCILGFHSTCVLNFIAHDAAYSLYPRATFEEHTSLCFSNLRQRDIECLSKYSSSAPSVDRRRKASISSLPIELLAKIFVEVHRICTFDRSTRKWDPWTIASVCPFWVAAILLAPDFWTRLTISLDVPTFSAASVAYLLGLSHNLTLVRVIFSRTVWTVANDQHERARVMIAMQAIASHMHRCRVITFNVRFSSSLPSISRYLYTGARHLTALELRCREDDGGATSSLSETDLSPIHPEPFQCPNLRGLAIDGRNYFNAYRQNLNWTEMFPALSRLSISHFAPVADRSESFTTSNLLLSLGPLRDSLTYLSLDDIHLDYDVAPIPDDDDFYSRLATIVFKNMHNTDCMTEIQEYLGWPSNVHFTRCKLDTACNYDVNRNVSLKEIDIGEDLVKFFTDCLSATLVIDGCRGFDDEVLDAMMAPKCDPHPERTSPCCCIPYLQDLSILNCRNFSISALKQLVETRLDHSVSRPHKFFAIPPIKALRLSGHVPDILPEDREWFKGHVSKFSYDPTK